MIFDIFQRYKAKHRHQNVRKGRTVNLVSVLMDRLRQKEAEQHLSGLTPQRAVELFSNYRAGKYADVQLVWDELEEQDDTLKSIVDSRLGGLAEMPWRVSVKAELVGEDAGMQQLAARQQKYLAALLNGVDNLPESIEHLGMADFRGYAALEVTGRPGHMRWEVIEPWNLARPVRNGGWLYNPEAQDEIYNLEELDMSRVILRETRRPIDLAAMFLVVEKSHGTHAWDAFLDTFGVPSIFFELAPNTSEEDAQEFDAVINRVLAEGRGTLPSGTKIQTVETGQNSSDAYRTRAEWCRDALLTLGLGGTLTATAESGSGTLAGNAHADSLARLCARSARGISMAINRCFCWPELRRHFPGQPVLVEFDLSYEDEEDTQALATMFATLAGARYRVEDSAVSEAMGMEVHTEEQPAALPGLMSRAAACGSGVASRAEEGRARLESREGEAEEGEPLTAEELALMKQYGEAGSLDLGKLAGEYEKRLEEAARAGFGNDNERIMISTEAEDEDGYMDLTALADEMDKETTNDEEDGVDIVGSSENYGCRAKVPQQCRIHGGYWHPAVMDAKNNQRGGTNAEELGLEKLAEMPGDKLSTRVSEERARKAMSVDGLKVRTMEGDWVAFDQETARHIEEDHPRKVKGIGLSEGQDRMQKLLDAMRAVRQPHEIWQELDEHGNPIAKLYIRVYERPNGKRVTLGVRWENESARLHTYYDTDKPAKFERKRKGKLLYKRISEGGDKKEG